MPYRATNTHKNLGRNEVTWEVKIYDEFGTVPLDFDIMGVEGVTFYIDSGVNDPNPGIYPLTAEVLFTVPAFGDGTNLAYQLIIDDIFENDEDRYALEIYKDSTLVFVGRFATHDLVIENISAPYGVRLVAHDGLASLRGLELTDVNINTNTTFSDTFLQLIEDILTNGLPTYSFYSGDFVDFVCRYQNDEFPDTTTNPLEYSRVNPSIFKNRDTPMNAFEALEAICIGWGMRLYYSNAMFHFEQLAARGEAASFYRWVYDETFTETASSGNFNLDQTIAIGDGRAAHGGVFTALEKLKEVRITLSRTAGNLATGLEWSDTDETAKSLGAIHVLSETTKLRLRAQFESNTTLEFTPSSLGDILQHRYHWNIILNVDSGSYGFNREYVFPLNDPFYNAYPEIGFIDIENPFSSSLIDVLSQIWQYEEVGAEFLPVNAGIFNVDLLSEVLFNEMPLDTTYELTMQVQLERIVDVEMNDIQADADYTFEWTCKNVIVELIDGDNPTVETVEQIFVVPNDLTAENVLEYDVLFGDAPGELNGVQVYDGTDWVYSNDNWYLDNGQKPLQSTLSEILAYDLLRIRRKTKRLFQGSLINELFAYDKRYNFFSKAWIPLGGRYSTARDQFDGTLLEIVEDDVSGIDPDTPIDIQNEVPEIGPTNPDAPPVPSGEVQPFVLDTKIVTTSGYSQLSVINNTGYTYVAGTVISVMNRLTGNVRLFQITEDIDGTQQQVVDIATKTFNVAFNPGDPLRKADSQELRFYRQYYTVTANDIANGYLVVTPPLVDPQYHANDEDYMEYTQVFRYGGTTVCQYSSDTQANMESDEFGVNKVGPGSDQVLFPTDYPMNKGEKVIIQCWYGRFTI